MNKKNKQIKYKIQQNLSQKLMNKNIQNQNKRKYMMTIQINNMDKIDMRRNIYLIKLKIN